MEKIIKDLYKCNRLDVSGKPSVHRANGPDLR